MTTDTQRILVLHGPNLNALGWRQPEIYGRTTLDDINNALIARGKERGYEVVPFQSNYEGALIDFLQAEARNCVGIVINPGGLTHTSVSLRDAIVATDKPTIEVHLSNVHAREEFRHFSYIAPIARGQIAGLGWRGYCYALDEIIAFYEEQKAKAAS
jgi:3-dehydroquinate dehydratase-2